MENKITRKMINNLPNFRRVVPSSPSHRRSKKSDAVYRLTRTPFYDNRMENKTESYNNSHKVKLKEDQLPEKVFIARNSLLTDLFENSHIKSIYNFFIAALFLLFTNTVIHDYLKKEEIHLGFRLIKLGFGRLHIALFCWSILVTFACLCYIFFNVWANIRKDNAAKSISVKMWDKFCIFILILYYMFSFVISTGMVTNFQVAPASGMFLLAEQSRLLMKVHAFIRSNAPKVLNYKPHSDQNLILPSFSYFLFFLFVPTLVYRDSYPRNKEIRWSFVAYRALEVIGGIFYFSFILERFLVPQFNEFGFRSHTWKELILAIVDFQLAGYLMTLCTFYIVLHSWMNMFAELLRFADRMFYTDWWTSTSFSRYYRTWNIIVHDWLYTYCYKDLVEYFKLKNTLLVKFFVFVLSAFFHEWIVTYSYNLFCPIIFATYVVIGSLMEFVKIPKTSVLGNIFFLHGYAFGTGLFFSVYSIEFFVRYNAALKNETYDFYVPQIFSTKYIKY